MNTPVPDSGAAGGSEDDKRAAFKQAHRVIQTRLMAFLAPPSSVWEDRVQLKAALDRIGFVEAGEEAGE